MKCCYFILFFALFFSNNLVALDFDGFQKIDNAQGAIVKHTGQTEAEMNRLTQFVEKASKLKPTVIAEEELSRDCSHCPKHIKLSGDINSVLEAMKKDVKVSENEEIPVNINRLKFMFYQVKSIEEDGSIKCSRFMDRTLDLKPTKLDGEMELMAENVFKFDGASAIQIMDPKKEEIVYYYRGEGAQKNIIIQAVLGKNGGKFRYYYYRPTSSETNPYELPSMGEAEAPDVTLKKAKVQPVAAEAVATGPDTTTTEDKIHAKNKFSLDVDPTLETRLKFIPKNVSVAKAQISQNIGGADGVRVGGDSHLSLKGNVAAIHVANEEGYQYVKVDVTTSLRGETTRTVTVPYEVRLGDKEDKTAMAVKGSVVDSSTNQIVSLALTDSVTTHLRTEIKREKLTNVITYGIAKDFNIAKDELATVAAGSNEFKSKYVSLQHRKAIKDNITMVLDMRVDENKKASFTYQLKARF